MSVPDSVGKWGVSGDVLDRALDAAYADPRWSNGHLYPEGWADFEDGLKLAAPIIAEAGYRAGIEAAQQAVEDLKIPETLDHAMQAGYAGARRDFRASLSALTDTEGREPASVEGGRSPSAATTDSDVKTNPVEGEN